MPAGRPSLYDPAYCEKVIELGREGKSIEQMSAALDVPRSTMQSWAAQHEEFSAALDRAKELEQAWWENVGQTALFMDKFQTALWAKSIQARFRDKYTERLNVEQKTETTFVLRAPSPSESEEKWLTDFTPAAITSQ